MKALASSYFAQLYNSSNIQYLLSRFQYVNCKVLQVQFNTKAHSTKPRFNQFQAAAHTALRGGFFEQSMNRRSYCLPVDGSWLERSTLAHMIPEAVSDSACSDQLAVAIRLTASTRRLSNQFFVEFTLNRTNRVQAANAARLSLQVCPNSSANTLGIRRPAHVLSLCQLTRLTLCHAVYSGSKNEFGRETASKGRGAWPK
ncbi:Hypothetical_protein [Hexamita inflata]|uniref:Hypothetical_protein n=1 Tax=Hexamita inflata TaxID=28002 RepID=A0AA86NAZ2_9EUKA|nr:Hypothetical protein HINF_LOCUS3611 [Hexamita inflata]